uniref:Sodium/calcium exchanger membrane region domain-containing protein n=2 Tax=Arion vulgaris TaxID=1028688 RepID=A0A0B7BH11_9EUPU
MMEAGIGIDFYRNNQEHRTIPEHATITHVSTATDFSTSFRQRSATLPSTAGSDDLTATNYYSDSAAVMTGDHVKKKNKNRTSQRRMTGVQSENFRNEEGDLESSNILLAENIIEANRISNNYRFGLKIWKSHVTSRPLVTRSEIVQDLYSDINTLKEVKVSSCHPCNILYAVLFGWWLSLLYIVVGVLMGLTVIGLPYAKFSWRMAGYFLWPFGKFVHQTHKFDSTMVMYQKDVNGKNFDGYSQELTEKSDEEKQSLLNSTRSVNVDKKCCWSFWKRGTSYLWLILGVPILLIAHSIVWAICWFFVISIPTAKLNSKTMTKILYLPPDEVLIGDSDSSSVNKSDEISEIIMYTHQSINVYYYKYAFDGVNVILANLLVFVILSIVLGYAVGDDIIDGVTKCVLSVLAIIPLTYYIGMAITSISAQSSFAVGAILNATFGSMVEVILFIIMLKKGRDTKQECYQELVKSSLTGAILCSILFIPGMSMVIGGLKFRTQRFNPRSANISASLLFVAIVGVFAPTIFYKIFGSLKCKGCEPIFNELTIQEPNSSAPVILNSTAGFLCQQCEQSLRGLHGDLTLYTKHIEPLVYAISLILPIAYIIGLLFTMKTHSALVFEEFEQQLKEENAANGQHGTAHWSRVKSTVILLLCAVAIALCADLISENIQPLLEKTGISEYFIGVTMLSLVAELPEVVNGVQFALQNNVNLGIEIGCSTAIQVCLVQIPVLVLINIIYPMGFYMVFNDIHLWAVIFSVVIINYIFQDGKSDYFQGSIVVFIYILLMCMYLFMLTPDHALCRTESGSNGRNGTDVSIY